MPYMNQPWRSSAACRGYSIDMFFFAEHGTDIAGVKRAKAICARCPVIAECLAEAGPEGIWGGLTADERRRIRRRGDNCLDCGAPCTPRSIRCQECERLRRIRRTG